MIWNKITEQFFQFQKLIYVYILSNEQMTYVGLNIICIDLWNILGEILLVNIFKVFKDEILLYLSITIFFDQLKISYITLDIKLEFVDLVVLIKDR